MAGKWSEKLEGKQKYFGSDPHEREKVQTVKDEIIAASSERKERPELQSVVDATERFRVAGEALQDVVDIRLDEPLTSARLMTLYITARRADEAVDRLLRQTSRIREAFEQMLVDQYEADDITNLKNGNGDAVRVEPQPHLVVVDKEKFRQWCVANGLESQLHLHWGTGNSLLKERLEAGMTEMDGCETWNKPKIVQTLAKKEK